MIFQRHQTVANGIGDELRLERQRQNLTLEQISQRTKIPQRSLEAIEAEDFSRLPGIVFTRNFVRLYALDLKLDPEEFVSRLPRVDVESAPMPDPPARSGKRTKRDPRLVAAFASVFWLVTAVGAGTGAWYYYNHYGRHLIQIVSAAPPPAHEMAHPAAAPRRRRQSGHRELLKLKRLQLRPSPAIVPLKLSSPRMTSFGCRSARMDRPPSLARCIRMIPAQSARTIT